METYTNEEIAAGKPVKQGLWAKVKANDEEAGTRLDDLEAAIGTEKPLSYGVQGPGYVKDGLITDKLLSTITVLSAKVYVPIAGASGTLQVDIEYKRGAGAWTSILSTPIQVAYSAGDGAVVSGVLAVTDLNYNDQIRINCDSIQARCAGWHVKLEHETRAP